MTGSFLYPFLGAEEHDAGPLLADLARSAAAKAVASLLLREQTRDEQRPVLETVAALMVERFAAGGRLLLMGNGGSCTDAASAAMLFTAPPWGVALPALSLSADSAVLTALANDVGFELVFARQVQAYARRGDILLGISTSGGSANVLRAFAASRGKGLLTVGLSGYAGGAFATSPDVEQCLSVGSDSVHRTQETQAALLHALWCEVQHRWGVRAR